MKFSNLKINWILTKTLFIVASFGFTVANEATAQVVFDGVEYKSMGEALTAVQGTVDPEWFTPERQEALGDLLSEVAVQLAAKLGELAITSRAPGGGAW